MGRWNLEDGVPVDGMPSLESFDRADHKLASHMDSYGAFGSFLVWLPTPSCCDLLACCPSPPVDGKEVDGQGRRRQGRRRQGRKAR